MSVARIVQISETALEIEAQLNNGRTGATALVALREANTSNSWLDFSDLTFKTSGWVTRQQTMSEVSAGNAPGLYRVEIDVTALLPARVAGDELIAEFDVSGTSLQVYGVDRFLIVDSGDILRRIDGLVGANQVIAVLTKDANDNVLTQRLRVYDTLANAQTDNGVTGLLETYLITATYDAEDVLATYEMVRVGS